MFDERSKLRLATFLVRSNYVLSTYHLRLLSSMYVQQVYYVWFTFCVRLLTFYVVCLVYLVHLRSTDVLTFNSRLYSFCLRHLLNLLKRLLCATFYLHSLTFHPYVLSRSGKFVHNLCVSPRQRVTHTTVF